MRYVKYFVVQLKRTVKLAVGVFPTAMLLFACLAIAGYVFLNQGPLVENQKKYKIGVVGDIGDSYLGFGIYAIQTLDDSRFMVDFIPMTEEEAQKAFRNASLAAYITVPDEFLDSIITGKNDVPIQYVSSEGQKGLAGYLMDELATVVSELVTSSQGAIYAFEDVVIDYGDSSDIYKWTEDFNLQLIENVLNRTKIVEVEEMGLAKGMMMKQYYFCAIVLLFCFLFGISSASFFLYRNADLGKWMKMRGIGTIAQVASEYFTYLLLMMGCTFIPLGILWTVTDGFAFLTIRTYLDELLLGLFPILMVIAAFHFALYEIVKNPVANLLLQFIGVVGMGYISGYIYPASFFPDGIAFVGRLLPTGAALEAFSNVILGERDTKVVLLLFLYFTVFAVLALLMRRRSIVKDNR
ncbi:MAG: ABC transporter permease [Lachnospiraceae bacterium]|nr:ABC transporter permease [Lachnospiraceae bacterium]